jgi:hypothetical protein
MERVTDHYDQRTALFADETATSVFSVDRRQMVIAAVAAGGIRLSVGRRAFVLATGILHVYVGDMPFSSQPASCRLGVGIKL